MSDAVRSWEDLRQRKAEIPAHVVFRAFANETVLLNITSGQYFGLDAVGGVFFETLRDTADLAAAAVALTQRYGQAPERIAEDLVAYVAELESRGLITLV